VEASKNIRKKTIDKIQQLFNDLTDKTIFHEITEIVYQATGNELLAKILREKTLRETIPLIGKIAKRYALSHALVLEQNSMGLNLIKSRHISEIDGRSYIPFSSKTYANKTLERIMTKGNFHNSYESVITEKNPELQTLKQTEYNLRIQQALLTSTYLYPNMIIVDKGSGSDEFTLVWIHNGQYKGYGFITSDVQITRENIAEYITTDTEHPEIQKAIKNYLKKSKVVKLIRY
jgi:DNA polymerase-3 subunit epsilon